jgi:hypothetical protein
MFRLFVVLVRLLSLRMVVVGYQTVHLVPSLSLRMTVVGQNYQFLKNPHFL